MLSEILVIDDANLHQSIVSKIATQTGFATTGASSVAEAAKLLRARTFDCITLRPSLGDIPASRCCSCFGNEVPDSDHRRQRLGGIGARGDAQDRQFP